MFHKLVVFLAACRRFFSRSEWAIRLLGLSRGSRGAERGLIIVQIDGLSRRQFQAASARGRMPFLRHLQNREHHKLHTMYSGLPSSTPATQAELFYGVKGAVPGFGFVDRATGDLKRMHQVDAAKTCEEKLKSSGGDPLLAGGSSYSNVFSGGAAETHFCAADRGWGSVLRAAAPHRLAVLMVIYADVFVRTAALLLIEFFLAVCDFFRGALAGKDLWKEFKFVPTRVAICILLRELVTAGAQIDAARGLPVIHVNYLGYDEQSHHRGPDSAFAHWSLSGIDYSIDRLWEGARRSSRRDYDLWIYSDHGQASVAPFRTKGGEAIRGAVARALAAASAPLPRKFQIAAMGPLGHIYPSQKLNDAEKEAAARYLTLEAGVPLVFVLEENGRLAAWNRLGKRYFPEDAAEILGKHHPFLSEMSSDLVRLAEHPDAGVLMISGWRGRAGSTSFQSEHGAHGGLSPEETSAFAILPRDAALPHEPARPFLRAMDLRTAALRFLGRSAAGPVAAPVRAPQTFRLMTYNVHSCIGMDGRLAPERIARIIAHHAPDVIALQEIEVRCTRTGCIDQVERIAKILEMKFHFHPSFPIEDGAFGNAILTRFPVRDLRRGALPRIELFGGEPRGVLSILLDVGGVPVRFLNTHLSIWPEERKLQARALCADWLDAEGAPLVLCGDFNALPGSPAYRLIHNRLRDAQRELAGKPRNTWFGSIPLARIDHVFIGRGVRSLAAQVPATALERAASDHLPLIVDLAVSEPAHGSPA